MNVYSDMQDVLNALVYTPYHKVRIVILGQDPYHQPKQAHGLCFSVSKGITPPPSLVNIFQELHEDVGCHLPNHGNLQAWAKQGVLLLNSVLTVRQSQLNSHANQGWERLTDAFIKQLDATVELMVFLLWDKPAKAKQCLLQNPNHSVLTSSHPSPYAVGYGFKGCHYFSKANAFLAEHGKGVIDWQI